MSLLKSCAGLFKRNQLGLLSTILTAGFLLVGATAQAAPSIATLAPADLANINALPDVQVTFDESVSGVAASDLTVNGSAASGVSGSGAGPYTFSGYSAPADGSVNVVLGSGAIINGLSEAFAGATWSYTLDSVPPTCTVSGPVTPTNTSPITFTITFDKTVTGFSDSFINVTNGTLGLLAGSGPYTIHVTPSADGLVTLDVSAGAGTDAFGNLSTASNVESITFDGTAPTVQSQVPVASATMNALPDVQVTFDENITGLSAGDLTVNGSAATLLLGSGAGPYTFSGFATPADGPVNVVLAAAGADAGGNTFAGDSWSYTFDATPPTVQSQVPAASATINALPNVQVTFDENVSGLSAGDLTVNGSAATLLLGTGAGPYTFSGFTTPSDGPVAVVLAGSGTDAAGNGFAGDTWGYSFDATAPTPTVTVGSAYSNSDPIAFTINFDEPVTGLDTGDFSLTNCTINSLGGSGAGPYSLSVSPIGQGAVTCEVSAGGAVDAANNGNVVSNTASTTYDSVAPSVSSLTRASGNPTNATSVNYTLEFNEAVTGVVDSDFSFAVGLSGTIGTPASSDGGITWTIPVTGISGSGSLQLDLADGSTIKDLASNGLTNAPFPGEVYTIDQAAPTVSSIVRADTNPTNATTVNFTVTFNEAVTGVDATNFTTVGTGGVTGSVTAVTGGGTTWNVQVGSVAGTGTLRVDLDSNLANITDTVTNPLVATFTTGEAYDVDQTAPTVSSIVRADTNPTNATTVNFTVTFDKVVTGVDATNFTPVGTGGVTASVTAVTGSGTTYNVQVGSVSGTGTLRIDLDTNLSNIKDAVTNALATSFTTGEAYDVDQTAPVVSSIVRADTNPTNATTVNFTVTFSKAVTGVDATNFTPVGTGGVTGSVMAVTGSGTTYNVQVASVAGTGTLRVDLDANLSNVQDAVTNALATSFTTGEAYDVDQTAPVVSSIVRADTNPTNATTVNFTVTFSKAVTGVDATNFTPVGTGGVTGLIAAVTGSGTTYNVQVSSVAGTGTLRVDLDSNLTNIKDALNNALAAAFTTGEAYNVDQTAPVVSSIVRADANPTNATIVNYTVTFSEPVTGVDGSNFTVIGTGGVTGSVTGVTGSGTTYNVQVGSVSGTGTLRVDLDSNLSNIKDGVNNAQVATFTTGEAYDIDQTSPTVTSIVRADTNPTNATTVNYTVTFSKSVTGVDATNFTPVGTGGVTGSVTAVTGSATTWNVQVGSVSGTGTLRVDLDSNLSNIKDSVTNALVTSFTTGEVYDIDQTAPTVTSIVRADTNPTNATTVNYTLTFSKSVTGVATTNFTPVGTGGVTGSVTAVTGSGTTYNVAVGSVTGTGTLRVDLDSNLSNIKDAVNNAVTATFTTGEAYNVDQTAPTVSSITRLDTNPTNAASVQFQVVFSEPVTGVAISNFTAALSGVTGSVSALTGSGDTYTVTVSTIAGTGTVRLDLDQNLAGITDAAANAMGVSFTSGESYNIDQTAPTVTSITRLDPNPTNATSVQFQVVFSEPVTGVATSSFTAVGAGVTGTVSGVSGSGDTYTVTVSAVSGDGTLRLDLDQNLSAVTDAVGNALTVAFSTGEFYTFDQTAPVVSSIVRADANPTNATTVNFTVTFNEAVTGVSTANFTVTGVSGSVTGVTGSGTTYNVAVGSVTGTGILGLNLDQSLSSITDADTNALTAAFTTGETYDIDQTAPAVVSVLRTGSTPTNATTLGWTVTFSEKVTTLTAANLALPGVGVTGVIGAITTSDDIVFNIGVNTVAGDGTLGLDVANGAGIADSVGNLLAGTPVAGELYTVDQTAPVVSSIERGDIEPITTSTVHFKVTFSELVTTLSVSNLTTTSTGPVTGNISSVVMLGTAADYEVTLTGVGGNGTLGLVLSTPPSLFDLVGNPLAPAAPAPDEFYTVTLCGIPGQVSTPTPPNGSLVPSSTSQLSWTTSPNTLQYIVTLDGAPQSPTTATTFALSPPLSPGTHTWSVMSDSGCGITTNGPTWTFQVLDAVTGPVDPPDGARLCSSPAKLNWNAAPGATLYNVFVDNAYLGSSTTTSIALIPPVAEGPHIWKVQSVNASAAIVDGPEWTFIVLSNGLINPSVWRTDGQVYAIASAPGIIYIAGNFTYVLSPDNSTWKPRKYIAAIDTATGKPTEFNPNANAPVYSLALKDNVLYAGGMFTTIGSSNLSRQRLAAIDTNTTEGSIMNWDPKSNGLVRALYADNTRLYVGGDFTMLHNTVAQNYLAAYDLVTTSDLPITNWPVTVSNNVHAITGSGNDIYIGGIFQTVNGQTLHGVAAIDRFTGGAHTWVNGAADLYVYALAVKNGRLYVGGQFNSMAGQSRRNLACIEPNTGALFGWNPDADRSVYSLMIDGNTVFAGGNFTALGTEEHLRLAGMHMITGAPIQCNYSVNNVVRALGNINNTLYAGGDFTQVASNSATGLAALGPLTPPITSDVRDWMLYDK